MTTLRKNFLRAVALVYRRSRTFVPDALTWLRREVQRADFAGRSVELTSGATGTAANSMLAMIHNEILVVIDGKKRFVKPTDVRSVGNVVFGGKVAPKPKTSEYEGKEEEIEDAALDDGKKILVTSWHSKKP